MTLDLPEVHPSVVHMLARAAERAPNAPALICGDEQLTYAEYWSCVTALAQELIALGLAGTRVAVLLGNSNDIAIATFAVQAAGAQLTPLNPGYTLHELTPILMNAGPSAILYDETAAAAEAAAESLSIATRIRVGVGGRRFTAARGAPPAPIAFPDPGSLSTLQYTGGTTGRSKGVDLTHAAVSINVSQREALLPCQADDERILAITPLFHVYAVSMCLYLAAYCRGTLVILPRYRPDLTLEAVERHRITLFSGSPTIFNGLMGYEGFARTDFASLRLCFSGAAALPAETLRRWEEATGCGICEGYGQSEAGPVLTFNPRHGRRKLASVGVPVPRTEVQIVDAATGRIVLPPGEVGEIRARGPQIMTGYRDLPAETAESLRDGWLHTGDIGEIDADGYLFIRDRKKDLVIVGGFNVYPREIEEALYSHPAVAEAAVVGAPDAYRGEILRAFIVPRAGATATPAEIQDFLATRLIKYKIPRDLLFIDALPKTSVGKVNKTALRQS